METIEIDIYRVDLPKISWIETIFRPGVIFWMGNLYNFEGALEKVQRLVRWETESTYRGNPGRILIAS